MATIDWMIVAGLMITIVIVGLLVGRYASRDSSSYFLGGRNMPWWLLGASMVATTFAADTPNLVTSLVRSNGVAANWAWWCFLITGMITAFVYARLWWRLGVSTDIEFYERRYSGKPAAFLRGFRAAYLGLFFNVMVMANVTLAAIKFGAVLFGIPPLQLVLVAGLVTVTFSTIGGLLGVLITDMILFVVALIGACLAAYFALNHVDVGGLSQLVAHPNVVDKKNFLPDFSDPNSFVPLFLVPLAVQWWSAWYPGAEPGGGGYVAQRMLSARNERHAMAATVFFNFAFIALRPWPWLLVALASLIVFPDLDSLAAALPHVDRSLIQNDLAYPAMLSLLPPGVLGIVAASLMAAYVSTISTSLNWGASYLVKDIYVRFIVPQASEKQQVRAGRLLTILLMFAAGAFALILEDALQIFQLLLAIGAGTGLLFFLRWFWFRINAWSEISAMIVSFAINVWLEFLEPDMADWMRYTLGVGVTTIGWVAVTFLTSPELSETQNRFKRMVWPTGTPRREIVKGLSLAAAAVAGTCGALFGVGFLLYGDVLWALINLGMAAVTGVYVIIHIRGGSVPAQYPEAVE